MYAINTTNKDYLAVVPTIEICEFDHVRSNEKEDNEISFDSNSTSTSADSKILSRSRSPRGDKTRLRVYNGNNLSGYEIYSMLSQTNKPVGPAISSNKHRPDVSYINSDIPEKDRSNKTISNKLETLGNRPNALVYLQHLKFHPNKSLKP
jgi:hypothetical protein